MVSCDQYCYQSLAIRYDAHIYDFNPCFFAIYTPTRDCNVFEIAVFTPTTVGGGFEKRQMIPNLTMYVHVATIKDPDASSILLAVSELLMSKFIVITLFNAAILING